MYKKLSSVHVTALFLLYLSSTVQAYTCTFQAIFENACVGSCAEQVLPETSCVPSCSEAQDAQCICTDNTYNTAGAQCIYSQCGLDVLEAAALVYAGICHYYGVSSFSAQQFVREGEQTQPSQTPATVAAASPSDTPIADTVTVVQPATTVFSTAAMDSSANVVTVTQFESSPTMSPSPTPSSTPSPTPTGTPTHTPSMGGQVTLVSNPNAALGRPEALGKAGALGLLAVALNAVAMIL